MALRPLAADAPRWAAYGPAAALPPPVIRDPALPLVSVVTPSLNQGPYIGATIASVLGQDYPNLEYWVIDAGSADETLAVLRSFEGDPRLSWLSEPDRGQSDAINKGWARCRGQVLAWLNADDTYLPGAIRGQVEALMASPGAGGVYGDVVYTDATGRRLARLYSRPFSPTLVISLKISPQPAVFLRREVVARAGPLDLRRRYAMDVDLWARAVRLAPWARNPALVATYRLHQSSKTVAEFAGFYAEWLAAARSYYDQPGLGADELAGRAGVLADIYAAMANLEARDGRLADAARYAAYALTLAGPRPRLLKLPVALLERAWPLGLDRRATELWGRLGRLRRRP
ncbi:MAG TPA: glycosyltransferase family 2 protein [Chloroflexaceae bacterium]|nr:glycosyltransferase family 2 protein [Chloroflexaceae bacterium]